MDEIQVKENEELMKQFQDSPEPVPKAEDQAKMSILPDTTFKEQTSTLPKIKTEQSSDAG